MALPWPSAELQTYRVDNDGFEHQRMVCNGCAEWLSDCVCRQRRRTEAIERADLFRQVGCVGVTDPRIKVDEGGPLE